MRCANLPVGCVTWSDSVFTSAELDPYLIDGVNTLSFGVLQLAGPSFGLDFAGSVFESGGFNPLTTDPLSLDPPTPEPSTLAFFGGGLVALEALRRRK
jgi:hypothetical protein